MKIDALRNLIKEYKQKGLPIEKRAYIKKQLGRKDYDIVAKEYDSFLRSDIIDEQPEKFISYDLAGTKHACVNVRLKRNLQKILLLSVLKKENILDTLSSAKKLAKIPVNKQSYLYTSPAGSVRVVQVPDTQHYKLINPKGEHIGAFSIDEINSLIGNFFISKKYRKTHEVKEALLAMKEFFNNLQYESIGCAVASEKPFLVRMYEKFGFRVKEICSINDCEKKRTFFMLQKEFPRYDIQIKFQ